MKTGERETTTPCFIIWYVYWYNTDTKITKILKGEKHYKPIHVINTDSKIICTILAHQTYHFIKREITTTKESFSKIVLTFQMKSEANQKNILYIITYIWALEKWNWWTYLQGRNRDADIESGLVHKAGEGEFGNNRDSGTDM